MTRTEILQEYTVYPESPDIIRSPGKFEGCMIYVPYFWNAYLNGFADRDDGTVLKFKITPEDRKEFPNELKGRRWISLIETNEGFVTEI